MILRLFGIFIFCASFLPKSFAQYEITFEASADKQNVEVGSLVNVHFTLTNAKGDNLKHPTFDGFEIVGGPNRLYQTKGINGVYTRTASFSFTLLAKKEGKYQIGAATIKAHGRTFTSAPFNINVLKKGELNSSKTIDGLTQNSYFIRAEPSKDTVYPGEQIVLDYKLYTLVNVDRFDIQRESDYNGFYMRPMNLYNTRAEQTEINGQTYYSKSLRRIAIYPQQSGEYVIDPIWMRLAISDPNSGSNRRGFFLFSKVEYKDVTSNELTITVSPLPIDQPKNFSTNFGTFSGSCSINESSLSTDDVLKLELKINGNGDPKRLTAPELNLGPDFQVYDPANMVETTREYMREVYIRKAWEYIIIPQKPGKYELIPEFIYYNPDSARYFNAFSDTFNIRVTPGKTPMDSKISFENLTSRPDSLNPISTSLAVVNNKPFLTRKWWFWILFLMPFGIFLFFVRNEREKQKLAGIDQSILRRSQAGELANRQLSEAKSALDTANANSFYKAISKAMKGYVSDKIGMKEKDMNQDILFSKLKENGLEDPICKEFIQILNLCDVALYSPSPAIEKMEKVYNQSVDLIISFEAQL